MSLNDEILPEYKLDVPHTPKRVLLHYTAFKTTWDWAILIFTLYTTVSVPFIVCFKFEDITMAVLDLMVDWLFLADIGLNFHTTYVGKDGEIIDNLKMIRMNYIRSWFFLDLVSSLPFGLLFFITDNSDTVGKSFTNQIACVTDANRARKARYQLLASRATDSHSQIPFRAPTM